MDDLPTFTSHLECSTTGERYPADQLHGLSGAGKPLLVRYDLDAVAKAVSRDDIAARDSGLWRYREFLPVRRAENIVSLGEVTTPLLPAPRLSGKLGCADILIKDEGRLPTGSFKAQQFLPEAIAPDRYPNAFLGLDLRIHSSTCTRICRWTDARIKSEQSKARDWSHC